MIRRIRNRWKRLDKNPESLKSIDSQQSRENDDLVDTDIDLEKNSVVEDSTEIT